MNALTLFDQFFDDLYHFDPNLKVKRDFSPKIDVHEEKDRYVVLADLPGLTDKDVKIELNDGILKISGERVSEKEEKDKKFYRKERTYGKFERAFNLNNLIDEDQVVANMEKGVLKIDLPKKSEKQSKLITIN